MFSVIFEVQPKSARWDDYLGHAKLLKPELEQIAGFIDNVRYRSLTRTGWLLSLSSWRDEKSVIRWRTHMRHHESQSAGRSEVFQDYHLRVGEVTHDTAPPQELKAQRLDETEIGEGAMISLIDAGRSADWVKAATPDDIATWLGLDRNAPGLVGWDVFEAVLTPGDVILLQTWHKPEHAVAFERDVKLDDGQRLRHVRIVRDYGMFDRREAPQYYPDAEGAATRHA